MMNDKTKEESEKEIEGRFRKIQKHFRNNTDRYVCLGTGAVIGAVAFGVSNKQIVVNAFQWKPFIWIQQVSMPAGHYREAIAVRCVETGEKFASMARAAKANDTNPGNLSKHLNGSMEHVNGLHFEKV